jgi:hypothetical protein
MPVDRKPDAEDLKPSADPSVAAAGEESLVAERIADAWGLA